MGLELGYLESISCVYAILMFMFYWSLQAFCTQPYIWGSCCEMSAEENTAVCVDPANFCPKPKSVNPKAVQMNFIMWLQLLLGFPFWCHGTCRKINQRPCGSLVWRTGVGYCTGTAWVLIGVTIPQVVAILHHKKSLTLC